MREASDRDPAFLSKDKQPSIYPGTPQRLPLSVCRYVCMFLVPSFTLTKPLTSSHTQLPSHTHFVVLSLPPMLSHRLSTYRVSHTITILSQIDLGIQSSTVCCVEIRVSHRLTIIDRLA